MMKTKVTKIEEVNKKDWTLELATLSVIGVAILGLKLCKNTRIKNIIESTSSIIIPTLVLSSIWHTIGNFTKSPKVVGIKAEGDNLYDILADLIGTNWRDLITVSDYNTLKRNFETNDKKGILIDF